MGQWKSTKTDVITDDIWEKYAKTTNEVDGKTH